MTERRHPLTPRDNPTARLDYLVELSGRTGAGTVTVRYVPDRWVLDSTSFHNYLEKLENSGTDSPEAIGVAVLDDFNNELVPRWLQVTVSGEPADAQRGAEHRVLLEDRQPNWDNPPLLSRLRRF